MNVITINEVYISEKLCESLNIYDYYLKYKCYTLFFKCITNGIYLQQNLTDFKLL